MNERNNKLELLGSAPIPKALMALGIPIMIGMLINALYNLVDAYFVAGLGKSQMGAISIVFPLGQVVVGLGLMFGNGAASYLSRLLGRGDKDTADKVASTALYSSILIGALGKGAAGFFLGACRQGVCFVPVILLLPMVWGMNGILYAQPIADVISVVITVFMALHLHRELSMAEKQVRSNSGM